MKESKAGQDVKTSKRGKTTKSKLSLYPLSVEDALRAAARTGRVAPAKSKRPKLERKKPARRDSNPQPPDSKSGDLSN
jgi:hypothetical protein